MPNTYKVQSGDTVSGIAQKLGVKQTDISGYKSGNASLIGVGEDLTVGGGGQQGGSTPAPTSPSNTSTGASFESYYKSALDQLKPGYDEQAKAISDAGKIKENTFETLAQGVEKQEPLVRQQYAALADQYKVQNQQQVDTANRMGTADIGNAKAALAGSGLSTATGSFYQPVAEAEAGLQDRLQKVAQSYNADSNKLQADMTKETSQLDNEASQYRAQGNNEMADVIEKQAEVKFKMDTATRQLASDYLKADNDQQKFQIEQKRLDLQEQHAMSMENIAMSRLSLEQSKYSTSQQNNSQAKQEKVMSEYGKSLSKPSRSVAIHGEEKDQTNYESREQFISYLQSTYPELDPKSIQDDVYSQYQG